MPGKYRSDLVVITCTLIVCYVKLSIIVECRHSAGLDLPCYWQKMTKEEKTDKKLNPYKYNRNM